VCLLEEPFAEEVGVVAGPEAAAVSAKAVGVAMASARQTVEMSFMVLN